MISLPRLLPAVLVSFALLAPAVRADDASKGQPAPAPKLAFTLKNQFDREYTEAYCANQTTLVTVADRKGSTFIGAWCQAIGEELNTVDHPPVRWVGVATLTGFPSLMRGLIKKMFGGNENQWTLMDWKGNFAKTYALPAEHTCILVFAPDGQLVFRSAGRELDPAVVKSIVAAIAGTAPAASVAAAH